MLATGLIVMGDGYSWNCLRTGSLAMDITGESRTLLNVAIVKG
jgi:hypothetical protein